MHRAMWMYVPTRLLLTLSVALPHVGPNEISRWNLSEFAWTLALWWLVFAVGWQAVRWAWAESRRDASQPRGFDVVEPADQAADRR